MNDGPSLSPHDFVVRRGLQIQNEILPQIEASIAQLEQQKLIFETEMKVLAAAQGALPPETAALSEFAPDNIIPFPEGGAN